MLLKIEVAYESISISGMSPAKECASRLDAAAAIAPTISSKNV